MESKELDLQTIVGNINIIFVALFEDLKDLVNNFRNKVNSQTISVPSKKPTSNTSGILGMASRLLAGKKNENFLNILLNRKKSLKKYKEFKEILDNSVDLIIKENTNNTQNFKKEANQFAANFFQIIQNYSKNLDREMSRINKEIAEKLGSSDMSPEDVIKSAYERQSSGQVDSKGNLVKKLPDEGLTGRNTLEFNSEEDEIAFYEALYHYLEGEYDLEDFDDLSPSVRKMFEENKNRAEEFIINAPQRIKNHLKIYFAS